MQPSTWIRFGKGLIHLREEGGQYWYAFLNDNGQGTMQQPYGFTTRKSLDNLAHAILKYTRGIK